MLSFAPLGFLYSALGFSFLHQSTYSNTSNPNTWLNIFRDPFRYNNMGSLWPFAVSFMHFMKSFTNDEVVRKKSVLQLIFWRNIKKFLHLHLKIHRFHTTWPITKQSVSIYRKREIINLASFIWQPGVWNLSTCRVSVTLWFQWIFGLCGQRGCVHITFAWTGQF